jgi:glycolate oxidase iron-sulfur subunit
MGRSSVQTSLPEAYRATAEGRRAETILRSCVHCGFCNATCPTYQLLGDELDGPRGRIYLIKEMLETETVPDVAVTHLDRCLTCRACETTCPSGVAYGELVEIGRSFQEAHHRRSWWERVMRGWLVHTIPDPRRFGRWFGLGRLFRIMLPRRLKVQLRRASPVQRSGAAANAPMAAEPGSRGRVLLLDGCVQRHTTPTVNQALTRLLKALGVEVVGVPGEQCCGGLALHLGREAEAVETMAANVAVLADTVDEVDAVISTASGCGVTLKDYGRLLDTEAARSFAAKVMDVGQYLAGLDVRWSRGADWQRVAFHAPCTLQHGQRAAEAPPRLLAEAGFELVPVADAHLCCGSAGTYSILQPTLADRLGENKVAALTGAEPDVIATANVGCQMHLAGRAEVPVVHWVELLGVEPVGAEPVLAEPA